MPRSPLGSLPPQRHDCHVSHILPLFFRVLVCLLCRLTTRNSLRYMPPLLSVYLSRATLSPPHTYRTVIPSFPLIPANTLYRLSCGACACSVCPRGSSRVFLFSPPLSLLNSTHTSAHLRRANQLLGTSSAVSVDNSMLRVPPWRNRWLLAGVAFPSLLHLAVLYLPGVGELKSSLFVVSVLEGEKNVV